MRVCHNRAHMGEKLFDFAMCGASFSEMIHDVDVHDRAHDQAHGRQSEISNARSSVLTTHVHTHMGE